MYTYTYVYQCIVYKYIHTYIIYIYTYPCVCVYLLQPQHHQWGELIRTHPNSLSCEELMDVLDQRPALEALKLLGEHLRAEHTDCLLFSAGWQRVIYHLGICKYIYIYMHKILQNQSLSPDNEAFGVPTSSIRSVASWPFGNWLLVRSRVQLQGACDCLCWTAVWSVGAGAAACWRNEESNRYQSSINSQFYIAMLSNHWIFMGISRFRWRWLSL